MNVPTQDDLALAFKAGAKVRCGLPTRVPMRAGGTAVLDLVAARKGLPSPWIVTHDTGDVVYIDTLDDRAIVVQGVVCPERDIGTCALALRSGATEQDRHTPDGDVARQRAGEIAMKITDAHIRTLVLTLVDGWSAVTGTKVDGAPDGPHGALYQSKAEDVSVRVLVVKCPSTGRRYAHAVPLEQKTALDARRWLMNLPKDAPMPDVET